jgi:hypothetical protein
MRITIISSLPKEFLHSDDIIDDPFRWKRQTRRKAGTQSFWPKSDDLADMAAGLPSDVCIQLSFSFQNFKPQLHKLYPCLPFPQQSTEADFNQGGMRWNIFSNT